MRGATAEYKCRTCKQPFTARVADRERGWARFCSKSCKAIKQVQRGGPSGPGQGAYDLDDDPSWDAHKGDR